MIFRFFVASIAVFVAVAARASDNGAPSFTVPVEVIGGYVIVDVRLNGAGPFHFMFDTGAGLVITSSAAQQLGLSTTSWGDGFGDGENKVRWSRTSLSSAELGEWRASDLRTGVVPNDDVEAVFGGFPLSGFIGVPLLKNMVVKLDYVHKTLTFTPADQFEYSGHGAVLPYDGYVLAKVDGVEGSFLVDTGTSPGLIIGARTRSDLDLNSKYRPSLQTISDWGLGGAVRTQLTRANLFEIGDIKIYDPVLRLSLQKAGTLASSYGRIGYGLLSRFDITFDRPRSRIIFERNSDFGRRDTYDRSGMWIGPDGRFFKVVDVVAGGPADAAGVKRGDTILAIDGVSTANLVLPVERGELERRPVGTKLALLLKTGDRSRIVVVTLRDLL